MKCVIVAILLCVLLDIASTEDSNSTILNQLTGKAPKSWKNPTEKDVNVSMVFWFVVVAVDKNNDILCFGSMVSAQSAVIPKKCWKSGRIVAIQKLKEENKPLVSYNVLGLDKEMSAQVAPDIYAIKIDVGEISDEDNIYKEIFNPYIRYVKKGVFYGAIVKKVKSNAPRKAWERVVVGNSVYVCSSVSAKAIMVDELAGNRPKYPGEPIFFNNQLIGLFGGDNLCTEGLFRFSKLFKPRPEIQKSESEPFESTSEDSYDDAMKLLIGINEN